MMRINPTLYAVAAPAAEHARKRDDGFFAAHPKQTWRVRPLIEGESPLVEALRAASGYRAYAIVLDHARAGDRRAKYGRGVYPLVVRAGDRAEMSRLVVQEAERWAKWFKRHSTTPPPQRDVASVTGVAS